MNNQDFVFVLRARREVQSIPWRKVIPNPEFVVLTGSNDVSDSFKAILSPSFQSFLIRNLDVGSDPGDDKIRATRKMLNRKRKTTKNERTANRILDSGHPWEIEYIKYSVSLKVFDARIKIGKLIIYAEGELWRDPEEGGVAMDIWSPDKAKTTVTIESIQ